ncbi:MAG: flagellar type III secretion system pore protein FliP [Deltaproteobacteria bacterium]|nr:flagellar type III secretion system pore protein FliP [Deltaproteobacteria bacterium]
MLPSITNALVFLSQTAPQTQPSALNAMGINPSFGGSSPVLLVVLLAVASVLPFFLLVATSFVKVSVVLGLARNALGTQSVPSNTVITALAAVLSIHIMAPTTAAVSRAAGPLLERSLSADVTRPDARAELERTWTATRAPIARFLTANSATRDRALFLDLAQRARARPSADGIATERVQADDLSVLLPAFVVSELTSAFSIGFLVFLPFLIVELVIANVLAALGLQSVSSSTVSLPFKLLLFVLADGWYLLARALVLGYR